MVTVMICGMNQQKHARRRKLTLATDATQPEVRSASALALAIGLCKKRAVTIVTRCASAVT